MKVLNFGSLNIDYTYQVDHFVRAGETMSSESLQVFSGGKGLNQSIALSKAGADVWHAGAVGAGDGDFLIEQMKKAGVHMEFADRASRRADRTRDHPERSGRAELYSAVWRCQPADHEGNGGSRPDTV